MPALDYRRARMQLRLALVLELIGYQPCWRQGQQWRGPCPLHGSGTTSSRAFAVHLGKNLFHCFRCGAGGNALELWAALQGLPLHAAVLDLCQRLHQEVPWLDSPPPSSNHSQATAKRPPQETTTMPAP